MTHADHGTQPHVSAVICTRNRHDKIRQAVDSVLSNDYPSFDLTIIDQSTDGQTREAIAPLLDSDPRLRYVFSEVAGLSRAYNTGIRSTSGEILAFTDDDCVAPPDWIAGITDAFERDPEADLLYGQVRAHVRQPDDEALTPALHIDRPSRIGLQADRFKVFGMGANYAARRRLFDRVGLFDEFLGGGGPLKSSQDYDLAYRTYCGGAVIILRPEVVIGHDGRREAADWPSLMLAYGIGDGAFYSKHVRCRDPRAAAIFARHAALCLVRLIVHRRRNDRQYVKGMMIGVRDGFMFDVDRSTRMYRARGAGNGR